MPRSQNISRAAATRIVHLTPDGMHWVEAYYELFKQHNLTGCSICDEPVFHPQGDHLLKETTDASGCSEDSSEDSLEDGSQDCSEKRLEEWLFITECT
jgi:hypothetical protein